MSPDRPLANVRIAADRILARKEFSRRRFVDDRHLGRPSIVALGESASGDERDSHRREIVRRDDDAIDVVALLHVAARRDRRVPARTSRFRWRRPTAVSVSRRSPLSRPAPSADDPWRPARNWNLRSSLSPPPSASTRTNTRFCGFEPRSTLRRLSSVSEKQPRAHEQHERDRHLHDEKRSGQDGAGARDAAAVFLQRGPHVHLRCAQRRCNAEHDARERRHACCEGDDPPIGGRRCADGRRQQRLPPARQEEAGDATHSRQQQALGQQLADETPARRTDRQPDGNFPLARCDAREQQIRDIRAHEQQHERDDRADDLERPGLSASASYVPRLPESTIR